MYPRLKARVVKNAFSGRIGLPSGVAACTSSSKRPKRLVELEKRRKDSDISKLAILEHGFQVCDGVLYGLNLFVDSLVVVSIALDAWRQTWGAIL